MEELLKQAEMGDTDASEILRWLTYGIRKLMRWDV